MILLLELLFNEDDRAGLNTTSCCSSPFESLVLYFCRLFDNCIFFWVDVTRELGSGYFVNIMKFLELVYVSSLFIDNSLMKLSYNFICFLYCFSLSMLTHFALMKVPNLTKYNISFFKILYFFYLIKIIVGSDFNYFLIFY